MNLKPLFAAIIICILSLSGVVSAEINPLKPSAKDKCPVCGMFVYKYPDWVGEILFRDGSMAFFDGAKDLFKYYYNLKKYNPEKTIKDIAAIYVTEYYDMQIIDAKTAFFVIGSDIYGPMGRELVPFISKSDAEAFSPVLTYPRVRPESCLP